MFDHLDAEIATALALDAATNPQRVEHARRRRAILGTLGLAVTAALTMVAAVGLSEERAPVVSAVPAVETTTTPAPTTPPTPPIPPPTTAPVPPPPTAPPVTTPPTPAPTSPPAPPPTAPPVAPPSALEWTVTAPPETESGEEPYPVTLTVANPTTLRQQYTAVICERVRRVTIEPGNVLVAEMTGSGCETRLEFVEPGDSVTWEQGVRMRTGAGKIPPGDYMLALFGLKLPVRIVSPV